MATDEPSGKATTSHSLTVSPFMHGSHPGLSVVELNEGQYQQKKRKRTLRVFNTDNVQTNTSKKQSKNYKIFGKPLACTHSIHNRGRPAS